MTTEPAPESCGGSDPEQGPVCGVLPVCVPAPQTHPEYDPSRCFAFVHDLCDEGQHYPVPEASLDVIVLIFVLSAIVPDK